MTERLADICAYIIERYGVSNLEMNKYLYVLQAEHMVTHNGESLFEDDFEAWAYGPVIKDVYNTLKYHGRNKLEADDIATLNLLVNFSGNAQRLEPEITNFIDNQIPRLQSLSITRIVNYTHESRPWIEAWNNGGIIEKGRIFEFHSSHGIDI